MLQSLMDFKDKIVLITGGTGSFGQSFIKHLLKENQVRKIIIFSRDEYKQFQMNRELNNSKLRFFIGDVRDEPRLKRAFLGVDIVVHAAALKQVPLLEYNPFEAVKTNVLGTQNVIEAAIESGVSKVLLISTDKAVEPVNLYGATKLSAEKLFVASNSYSDKTRFSVVRYGNVIGSRGSIIETLLNIKDGEVIKITDPEMTRFWISLDQTFDLVNYALANMAGGEIFVPKIPSLKIGDLFNQLLPDRQVEIIGVRPGEKKHERLLTQYESAHAYDLGKYFVVLPEFNVFGSDYGLYEQVGTKLPYGFCYQSDQNSQTLSSEEIKQAAVHSN